MATEYLEVDCVLCEKPRLSKPEDGWFEILMLGPKRRAHSSCFHEIMFVIRDMTKDDPDAFLAKVEERERRRGIEPPLRKPKPIPWSEEKKLRGL